MIRQTVKKSFEKDIFKLINHAVFEKTMKNWWNIKIKSILYNTYNNRKEKNLFSIRTKSSCYKDFHGKFISNRNENNTSTNE